MPFIHSVKAEVPQRSISQTDYLRFVEKEVPARLRPILKKIVKGTEIRKRHLSMPKEEVLELTRTKNIKRKFEIWKEVSLEFFRSQIAEILKETQLNSLEIDGICTVTSSGMVLPGLDCILQGELSMRPDITRIPLTGYGCSGGMAGINRVKEYLEGHPEQAILLCVGETPSTQWENPNEVSIIVANSLFGDGYATMLMVGDEHPLSKTSRVRLREGGSMIFPNCEFAAGQWIDDVGICTHLDYKLPKLVKQNLPTCVEKLSKNGFDIPDFDYWICHIGGPKVSEAFRETLNLSKEDLHMSMETFRNFGNQSAASVVFALDHTLKNTKKPGLGFMMGIGPGVHFEYTTCDILTTKNLNKKSRSIDRKSNKALEVVEVA